ncbi:hypothetical protein GOP47_0024726 [Adiantum capillus-veneris]|uniref:LOB domain-containing protein n=1 Tax=Adiantum capillus-veneris TaxID=13818 RepID=A0A9D4U2A0_ADICA|nr:hypothetical protein GOP47_0024726 [Adiantum capillus-veneris]
MSCNGCRVLRKGCSDTCILRSSLQWIESPEAQGHATVFIAKFFGRAGMISFISAVSESQRPALFQSLLYEACGRTVNPVFGAVGLLWSGNWGVCQAAVETVLKGGSLRPAAACMPALPTKPTHSLTCRSNLPPLTNASPTLTTPSNQSLKRTQSAQPSAEAPVKRVKICVQQQEPLQEASNITSEVATLSQGQLNYGLLCKQASHESNNFAGMLKCEQGQVACGQLHAPVPRRVKPQIAAVIVREHPAWEAEHATPREENATPREEIHGAIELDLTLNSHGNLAEVGSTWKMNSPPFMRVSSPSSFSVNSEGSVTNSDTAEYTMSCLRTLSAQGLHHVEERKLLHLL